MLKRKSDPPRGVLHLGRDEPDPRLERFEAGEALHAFVEHYWAVTWEEQPPVTRETVPHPSVHLVLEPGRCELHGVYPRRFSRIIEGSGRVLGIKFRPGGFRAFVEESVARFTGKIVAPSTVFGPKIHQLEAEAEACAQAGTAFELVDDFLTRFNPTPTAELASISEIVRSIADDRSITRVEMLAEWFDVGRRQLQRVFRDYVGVSPKWVIRRYRLIEAAERLRCRDDSIDFALLALDLGYSDQSHFIRDFKNMVGRTPADYHKSLQDTGPARSDAPHH
jgi:AraC-like DNA-binding protein